jgi:FkbM family methyltransferase
VPPVSTADSEARLPGEVCIIRFRTDGAGTHPVGDQSPFLTHRASLRHGSYILGTLSMPRLPLRIQVLGLLMRHMPRGPRKLDYWWWLLFKRIGGGGPWGGGPVDNPALDEAWPKVNPIQFRGRHGVRMLIHLQNWFGRTTYFSGAWYQQDLVFLLEKLVRRRDTFIDIGAQSGLITVLAAHLTGRSGSVYAIEPNPDCLPLLQRHMQINRFTNVEIINVALSNREGEARLITSPQSPGWVSLRSASEGHSEYPIRLVRGDDILAGMDPSRPVVIKTDTEGHEVFVLQGLSRVIERPELAVICEVSRAQLSRAGATPDELFEFMKKRNFSIYKFETYHTVWNQRLRLTRLDAPLSHDDDYEVLFIRTGTAIAKRLNI